MLSANISRKDQDLDRLAQSGLIEKGSRTQQNNTILSLQYLRAIAAMLVVYFHAELQASYYVDADVTLPRFGASGVDIFFVLSGYVMWLTTVGRRISPVEFMKRRIVRIAPLYWIVTLATAALALTVPSLMRSTKIELPHLLASFAFIPWPNPGAYNRAVEILTPVVVPGWTLNMEMLFYLIFAALLPLTARMRVVGLAVLIGIAFAIGCSTDSKSAPYSFYGSTILFEFWLGVALANLITKAAPMSDSGGRPGTSLAFAMYAMWFVAFAALILADWADPGGPRVVSHGLSAMLIVGIAIVGERKQLVPRWPWLQTMGDASYSLYLTHGFVIAGTRLLFTRVPFLLSINNPLAFIAVATLGSIIVALLTHYVVEKPLVAFAGRFGGQNGRSMTAPKS